MFQFKIFQPYQNCIYHGITLKGEGNFQENQPQFKSSVKKLNLEPVVTTHQIHTDKIIKVMGVMNEIPEADALITDQPDITLLIKVADCQGVLMFDPVTQTIAAAHSGWKGSCLNIIGKTVKEIQRVYEVKPENLLVGIGPSLGPCCARFSDPWKELPEFIHPYILDHDHVDFWSLTLKQLKEEGIKSEHIELPGECSKCNAEKYFSHRRGDAERMGVFIVKI